MSVIRTIILLLLAAHLSVAATATFFSQDTTTQGNWVGVYGADGWYLVGDTASIPAYSTTPVFTGWSTAFASTTTDVRALQDASNHAIRNEKLFYTGTTATVDFTITGTVKLSYYTWAVDSDSTFVISVLDMDNGGATLDTRSIASTFTTPRYTSWLVSGHIRLSIAGGAGNGGRLSGLFFDPASPIITSATPSAVLPGGTQNVSITGVATHFVNGTTTVSVSGTGVTTGAATVTSPTTLTVPISASTGAALGSRTVTVTTGSEAPTTSTMVGAPYWRMNTTMGAIWSIAEWRFYDSTSAEISRTGGTATASSTNANAPSAAFDNNATTFWASNAAPNSLTYQFPAAIMPSYFTLQSRSDSATQTPVDFSFQYSGDGVSWSSSNMYYYGVNWSATLGAVLTFNTANAAPLPIGISWRINITANAANQAVTMSGFQFLDSGGTPISTVPYAAITSSTLTETIADSGMIPLSTPGGSNYWASTTPPTSGSPQWIGYRFASSSTYPASIKIWPRSGAAAQAPTAFTLQSSTDEITWTTVQTYTALWSDGVSQTFAVPVVNQGRSYMVLN